MRRWTFFFDEGNIKSEVSTEDESNLIASILNNDPKALLYLPGNNLDIYVNLSLVKCIASQEITQEILDAEKGAQEPSTKAPDND